MDSGEGIHDLGDDEYAEHFGFREIDLVHDTQRALLKHIPLNEVILP